MLTPPFGSILDFFEFQTLFYIAPRVTYGPQLWNLGFFEKFRPPPHQFSKVHIWILDLFVCFLTPSSLFWKKSKIFPFFNYEISPNAFWTTPCGPGLTWLQIATMLKIAILSQFWGYTHESLLFQRSTRFSPNILISALYDERLNTFGQKGFDIPYVNLHFNLRSFSTKDKPD